MALPVDDQNILDAFCVDFCAEHDPEAAMTADPVTAWAMHVRDHPYTWKREHTRFIDAQFAKHRAFVARLRDRPEGPAMLDRLYRL